MNVSRVITLKEGEKIIRVVRSYWAVHLPGFLVAAALMIVPFFLMLPLFRFGWVGTSGFVFFVTVGVWYGFRAMVVWYWNVFVITNLRVVDVNQRGFFRRYVSEASYEKIQDASYGVSGVWQSLLNFGAVRLITAAGGSGLELTDVQDPKGVHHLITETVSRHREQHGSGSASDKVASLLETVSELSDVEAKAFLVALQRAVSQGSNTFARESAVRGEATSEWLADKGGEDGIFREEVVD